MRTIGEFCDQAAGFFIDPMNEKFSPAVQSIAVIATLLIGIATLGIAQAIGALWRRLRCIEEKNETHALVYEQFKKVFGIKTFTEENEKAPAALSYTDEQKDPFFEKPSEVLKEETHWPEEASRKFSIVIDTMPEQPQAEQEKPLSPTPEVKQPMAIFEEKILKVVQEPLLVHLPLISAQIPASQLMNDRADAPQVEEKIDEQAAPFSSQSYSVEKLLPVKAEPKVEEPKAFSSIVPGELASGASGEVLDEEEFLLDKDELLPAEPPQESPTAEQIKIYKKESNYQQYKNSDFIFITVIKKGIKVIPEFHLENLSQAIESRLREKGKTVLMLAFMRESDMQVDPGIDSGGLSRDYLDDLLEGLVQSKMLVFKTLEGSSLALPEAMMKDDPLQPLPKLSEKEQQLYRSLGILMMFCYQSVLKNDLKHYLLGRRFDEGLFKAALSLTAEEINTPFEQLSLQAKLKMCQALLDAHVDAGRDFGYLKKRLDWVSHFDQLKEDALFEAALSVHGSEFLPPDYTINNQDEVPDMDKIKQNREEFKKFLIASLFSQKGSHGQFGPQLASIHAIAQGMKSICHPATFPKIDDNDHWDAAIRQIGYTDFSNNVQGLLDRKDVAARIKPLFQYCDAKTEIGKKVKWLQDWIKDETKGATEEELKKLLKFLTGTSSIPKDKFIVVEAQSGTYYPVPIAHTCSLRMELAPVPSNYGSNNDHTKANFIKSLKTLALNGSFGFQMG